MVETVRFELEGSITYYQEIHRKERSITKVTQKQQWNLPTKLRKIRQDDKFKRYLTPHKNPNRTWPSVAHNSKYLQRQLKSVCAILRYNDFHNETRHDDSLHKARPFHVNGILKCYCDHDYCNHQLGEDTHKDISKDDTCLQHKPITRRQHLTNPKDDICHPGVSWHGPLSHEKVETVIK